MKKIIGLEGLDGTGKSALANKLRGRLGDQAELIQIPYDKNINNKTEFYQELNHRITTEINQSSKSIIILDRTWLSGEATLYAEGKNEVSPWPDDLYRPTHLFVLTLPEEARKKHILNRQTMVPITSEEVRLENDEQYRLRYAEAYRKEMFYLRTSCIYREFDSDQLTLDEISDRIIHLLNVDLSLLNPRNLATGDKALMQPLYSSWQQRKKEENFLLKDYFTLIPNEFIQFDEQIRQRHQCHFDNLGIMFDYKKFSEPRHPPLYIGSIEQRKEFDIPFDENIPQAQDMPIALRTDDPNLYEYRIPMEYQNLREFIQKVINVYHSIQKNFHHYYCYLTISHGIVQPWTAQRRPTIHSDGFQGTRLNPKVETEYAFVAANELPTWYYIDSFDVTNLDPAIDNYFVVYSRTSSTLPLDCQKPYDIMMMDGYCLHSPVINTGDEPILRTFVRIIYSPRIFDRLGNTHNPHLDYQWEMVRREAQMDLPNRT
ncbi:unnamed protein product [Adineta steineri]|uniref:Thymidylate kinase n=1 Tax=Adineta steineri TaxID=433720 RepID=A0A818SNL3_9BILA|nr:unnamed protein product [Adineta steineri]CAF3675286.1 unnamed protein product [Adineta steineri]